MTEAKALPRQARTQNRIVSELQFQSSRILKFKKAKVAELQSEEIQKKKDRRQGYKAIEERTK